ncbi:nuclease NurA [Sulfolobus sp. E3]|nr:nuclease NurA [Sulfolobus sp. E3]
MGIEDALRDLILILSKLSKDKKFLGVKTSNIEESNPVFFEENFTPCDPLSDFGYLDSSSRVISIRGANLYFASLYANDSGSHIMVPLNTSVPFIAIKASEDVTSAIQNLGFIKVQNPNGEPYSLDYKDDNILDEMRISLENYAINKSRSKVVIVDGPIFPGPYLEMVGDPYKSAFETLALQRNTDKLIGIVKRLNFSRKLRRVKEIEQNYPELVKSGATDDIIVMEMGKGSNVYLTPIYSEEVTIRDKEFTRYMVYVKVFDSVFRVESMSKDLLCKGVSTAIKNASFRGIPTFIEVADKMSRKLSASVYVLSFTYAKGLVGITYDDWNRFIEANRDLND